GSLHQSATRGQAGDAAAQVHGGGQGLGAGLVDQRGVAVAGWEDRGHGGGGLGQGQRVGGHRADGETNVVEQMHEGAGGAGVGGESASDVVGGPAQVDGALAPGAQLGGADRPGRGSLHQSATRGQAGNAAAQADGGGQGLSAGLVHQGGVAVA